jgi:hypothetical protein
MTKNTASAILRVVHTHRTHSWPDNTSFSLYLTNGLIKLQRLSLESLPAWRIGMLSLFVNYEENEVVLRLT